MRMKAVKLSGESIFRVLAVSSRVSLALLAVDSTWTCPASKVAWACSTDCLLSLTVNYYGVYHV
jgi:hypothetical protein